MPEYKIEIETHVLIQCFSENESLIMLPIFGNPIIRVNWNTWISISALIL